MRDPIDFSITNLTLDGVKSLMREANFYCLPTLVDICVSFVSVNENSNTSAVVITNKNVLNSRKLATVVR